MSSRRYHQYCGVAYALDVVGERWSLLIVRDLLGGPQRYSDLLHRLRGIPTDMLANRLRHLEAEGIVRRSTLPPPAASKVYELTERGRQLEPVILELSRWGNTMLGEPAPDDSFHPSWLGLYLKARFRPERAEGAHLTVNIHVDGESLGVEIADGELAVHPEPLDSPMLVISGDLPTLTAVARGEDVEGRLDLEGKPGDAGKFAAMLGLPAAGQTP